MTPSDWSAVSGLFGTIFLAIVPCRVEWFRFRSRKLDTAEPKNTLLAELVKKSKDARESIIVAEWKVIDSINVFAGILLLMISYIIPLCF